MKHRVELDLIDMPQASRKRPATPDPSRIVLSRFSRVQLSVTPWTITCQPPLSMGFSRQEYWSGLPCPPPEDLPNPEIEPKSSVAPAWKADSLPLSHQGSPK